MHAFQTLQHQPFHHVKRKLRLALTAVITRLQCRDGSQDSSHFPQSQSQSPAHLWKHRHILMEDHVWIYYRVASYPSVESVLPQTREGLDMQEASGLRRQHEGLLHILWDCVDASKMWAYIILQWTRAEVSSAQMVLHKQTALLRSAPELPPSVREVIKQVFPDHDDIAGRACKRIWWIACFVCVTTLWIQRNRSIHKRESASTELAVVEVKQVLLRQLRAVAMTEQRENKDVSNGDYFHLATELFQYTIGSRQTILHSPRYQLKI